MIAEGSAFCMKISFLTRRAGRALCLLLLTPTLALAQADYARERRWAEEITPAILVGDPVHLELKSGRKFLAIWAPNRKAVAGVIVVHGMGVHPDWGLINPLRSQLAEQGYATLSVQMPVLAADARGGDYPPLFPEAAERLAAAADYLRARGQRKVAIVSHSMGSRMTDYYLNQSKGARVDAWVAIGTGGEFAAPPEFQLPVLDLYGEKDNAAVLHHVQQRASVLKQLRGSAQVEVPGADHFFAGMESELVRRARQFLDKRLRH
jgi:pimeloyl-ACP methyl ester carboxylesterase